VAVRALAGIDKILSSSVKTAFCGVMIMRGNSRKKRYILNPRWSGARVFRVPPLTKPTAKENERVEKVEMYTDGACKGNPGSVVGELGFTFGEA